MRRPQPTREAMYIPSVLIRQQASTKNSFVRKFNGQGQEQWRLVYENTPLDGRGVMIALDEAQNPYVVFTLDGGSSIARLLRQ
ncbi:hypothetical protein [Rhodoflexus sp.]